MQMPDIGMIYLLMQVQMEDMYFRKMLDLLKMTNLLTVQIHLILILILQLIYGLIKIKKRLAVVL